MSSSSTLSAISKLLINAQRALRGTLNQIVRGTGQFRNAEASGALELARGDIAHPELQLRMGVHSGPVGGVVDVSDHINR